MIHVTACYSMFNVRYNVRYNIQRLALWLGLDCCETNGKYQTNSLNKRKIR